MSPATRNSLLLFVAALIIWRLFGIDEETPVDEQPSRYQPDFVAEGLEHTGFDEQGKLAYRIRATQMEYFAELELTTFAEPVVRIYPSLGEALWEITAREGLLTDQSHVIMQKDVKITNLSNSEYLSELTTSLLEVDLTTNTLSSDRAVTLHGPQYDLQGVGMQGDLANQTLTLLDNVNAVYHNEQD